MKLRLLSLHSFKKKASLDSETLINYRPKSNPSLPVTCEDCVKRENDLYNYAVTISLPTELPWQNDTSTWAWHCYPVHGRTQTYGSTAIRSGRNI